MKISKPRLPELHRLIRGMTNAAYHATAGASSSSQLKDLIDDEEVFIKKHVKMEIAREENEAFDTGTYFHTGVLEPHLLKKEIAVFEGKTRYGKAWDEFRAKHKGKVIITNKQKEQGDGMIKAVQGCPISKGVLDDGEAEVSLFTKLVVYKGEIFAPNYDRVLTPTGWVGRVTPKNMKGGFELVIKVRADYLGPTYITDLKSTSGRANKSDSIRHSISKYKYDLSAALYLDMFNLHNEDVQTFNWVFASKEHPCCAVWEASKKNILIGRAKWSWAVKRLADLSAAKWEVVSYLRVAEPMPQELEWLEVRESDLL